MAVLLSFFADGGFSRVAQTCSVQVTSFPKGVTRGIPLPSAVTHHLLKAAQQGYRALDLSLCAWERKLRSHSRRLSRVCVPIGGCASNAPCTHPRERSLPRLPLT